MIYKDNNYNTDLIKDIHDLILKFKNSDINNNSDKNQLIQNIKLNFNDLLNLGYNYKIYNLKKVEYPEYILNKNNVEI